APENIRNELISGGNTEKFISYRASSNGTFSTANPGVTSNDTQQLTPATVADPAQGEQTPMKMI
ncbi:MAG: hypothetical protein WCB92_12250, partial [Mycobacterium sp.]